MKRALHSMALKADSVRELMGFIWQGKNWWLQPLVLALALLTLIVVFLEGSALAPFIYVLF